MLAVIIVLVVILAVSLKSEIHALGLWLVVMIAHDFIVEIFGSGAGHLPLFAGATILAVIVTRNKWTGVPANVLYLLISLYVVMMLAAIVGINSEVSLFQILWFSKGIVLAILLIGTIKSDAQIQCLTRYCVIGILLAVCVTFYEDFTGIYFADGSAYDKRPGGFTGNSNGTAALLVAGIPFSLYWATHSKSRPYAIAQYLLIGLIAGAVVLTQSRGGFVSLILLLFLLYIRRPSLRASAIGLVILSALLLVAPVDSDYWNRIGTLLTLEDSQGSTSLDQRKYMVQAGIEISLDNPILGVGMGNFGEAMGAADPNIRIGSSSGHNMYLEFIVENGVLGWLFFMAILGIAALQSLRYDKGNESEYSTYGLGFCTTMSLISLLISGLFDSIEKEAMLWFLVGICFAFQQVAKSARLLATSKYADNLAGY